MMRRASTALVVMTSSSLALALLLIAAASMDLDPRQAAMSEGWHVEDLITFDDCQRRARDGDHLLL